MFLEAKVKNGGAGVWGDVPMPPNSNGAACGVARDRQLDTDLD
jgi:cytochrome c551/c552